MAKKTRMSVLKRQRELRKQEKAALKRERKSERKEQSHSEIPTKEDLAGYGLGPQQDEDDEDR
jgi:hypothetical protein